VDWLSSIIGPDDGSAAVWQLCVRAVLLLALGVGCVRIAGRRTFAQASPLDIVVAIVIGSNISRVMTGKAPFLGGVAATLTLVVVHRLLAVASVRWGWVGRFTRARAVRLVEDGRVDERAMRAHGVCEDDLLESLRNEQVERPQDVRLATLEAGGKISVVPKGSA
jgi:uncharacterized membrane protein YcaP (DUF421 family)